MDSTELPIFEDSHDVSLGRLLKGPHRRGLEAKISHEVLGNLTDESLEGKSADEVLSGLLVTPDLTEGDGSWAIPVGLLVSRPRRRQSRLGLLGHERHRLRRPISPSGSG